MLAARRSYVDAVRWVKSARPPEARGFSRRAFAAALTAGLGVMALIAFTSPTTFGARGSSTLRTGWPGLTLLALLIVTGLLALFARARIAWAVARIREPLRRPLEEHECFSAASDALRSTAGPFRSRFAASWIVLPAGLVVLGTLFSFSAAYFAVDALLARFDVTPFQPLYGIASALLALATFRLASGRASTWRLAVSVYKDAAGDYD